MTSRQASPYGPQAKDESVVMKVPFLRSEHDALDWHVESTCDIAGGGGVVGPVPRPPESSPPGSRSIDSRRVRDRHRTVGDAGGGEGPLFRVRPDPCRILFLSFIMK